MLIRYLFRLWGCTTINQQFSFGWFPLKSTPSSTSFCLIVFFCLCSLACIKNIRDKSGGITRKPRMTIMPNKTTLKFFFINFVFRALCLHPTTTCWGICRASIRFHCFRLELVNNCKPTFKKHSTQRGSASDQTTKPLFEFMCINRNGKCLDYQEIW